MPSRQEKKKQAGNFLGALLAAAIANLLFISIAVLPVSDSSINIVACEDTIVLIVWDAWHRGV
jgi:hypothetical protein